jgi:hypothetical protein
MSIGIYLRPASAFEALHLTTHTSIQFGIEVDNPKIIPEYIDEISRLVLPLHIAARDKELWKLPGPIPITEIPKFVKTLSDACTWMGLQGLPKDGRICNLGISGNRLVMNVNHMAGDGGLFLSLVDYLGNGRHPAKYPQVLKASDILLADEIARSDPRPYRASEATKVISPISHPEIPRETLAEFIRFDLPTSELQCFDQTTKKVSRLTESIWTSFIIAASVFNDKLEEFCCPTCYDLRTNHNNVDFEKASLYTIVAPKAICRPTETIGEMGSKLRRSLNDQLTGSQKVAFMRGIFDESIPSGCSIEISHLGRIRLKKPIVDMVGQIQMEDWATANCTSLLSYAKVNESGNHFHAGLRYPRSKLSREQAAVVAKLIEFGLRNLSPKMTIKEAFEAVSRQKSK